MKNKHINLIGWILFIISEIGFIIAGIGSFWSMVASVFFLLACLVFLIPFFKKISPICNLTLFLLHLFTGQVGNEIKSFSLPDLINQLTSISYKLLQSIDAISIPEKNLYPVKVWWSLVELP